jgi:hypothetical protein
MLNLFQQLTDRSASSSSPTCTWAPDPLANGRDDQLCSANRATIIHLTLLMHPAPKALLSGEGLGGAITR